MKKFLCVVMSVVMFALMSSVNAFAIQDDVYKAYANELSWLNKTSSVEEYCVYDMNKDGIKELIVKTGTCEADYPRFRQNSRRIPSDLCIRSLRLRALCC